jgi:hypothetical protein
MTPNNNNRPVAAAIGRPAGQLYDCGADNRGDGTYPQNPPIADPMHGKRARLTAMEIRSRRFISHPADAAALWRGIARKSNMRAVAARHIGAVAACSVRKAGSIPAKRVDFFDLEASQSI